MRIVAALVLSIPMLWCMDAAADCAGRKVDAGGYGLWMQSRGEGAPTVVFESGGGEDSSEWSSIDITAEHTWVDAPDEVAAMRRAHAEFVASSPHRVGIFAEGSGHYISRDRPEIVIDAILRLISEIQKSEVKR